MSPPKVPQKKTQQQNCDSLNSCNTYTSEDGHATATRTTTNSTYNPLLQQQHDTCETQFTTRQHIYNQHKKFVTKLLNNLKLSVCVKRKGRMWFSKLLLKDTNVPITNVHLVYDFLGPLTCLSSYNNINVSLLFLLFMLKT